MKPYIGITGFTNYEQVGIALGSALNDSCPASLSSYQVMIGVLVSRKTLVGEPTRDRYAKLENLPELFIRSKNLLNLIHYNTRSQDYLPEIKKTMELAGPNFNGFQLNMCWPDPRQLEKLVHSHSPIIVLQIGSTALEQVGKTPSVWWKKSRATISIWLITFF